MLAGARRGLRVVARRRRPTAAAARFLSSETPETPAAVETPETPAVAPLVSSRHGYQETRPGGTSKFARHRIIAQQRDRLESMEAAADASGLRWRLATTLVVERTQQLMPDLEPWEDAMWRLQANLEEYEGFEYPESVMKEARKQLHPDTSLKMEHFEDRVLPFELAPRVTKADEECDRRSLERALTKSVFLLIKGSDGAWKFPESDMLDDEETPRAACERAMEEVGSELYTYIMGNGPNAIWPREERRDDVFGVRSFYMKAIVVDPYDTGPVVLKNAQDYAWVTKDDLAEFIPDEEYRTFLGYIL